MAGLQRSEVSFRRQGSSGLVWDDRFLSGELNKLNPKDEQASEPQLQGSGGGVGGHQEGEAQGQERVRDHNNNNNNINMKDVKPARSVNTMERSRSNGGGRGYRTGRVSPAIEPPSPRVSACGFCSAFSKTSKKNQLKKSGKRRSR